METFRKNGYKLDLFEQLYEQNNGRFALPWLKDGRTSSAEARKEKDGGQWHVRGEETWKKSIQNREE